jgi:hypothetical protein
MYKKILTILILGLACNSYAQNYNPFVAQGIIAPAPITDQNGNAVLGFIVGNSGDNALPLVNNQEMLLVISLSRGVPNHAADPVAALSGSFKSYFNWQYDSVTNSFLGTQNQLIPDALNGGVGDISIAYHVMTPSLIGSPQNGFNVNVTPPAYTIGINSVNDDQVSSYTYTDFVVPLTWKSFDVSPVDCSVRIDWATFEEKNTSHFEIQRKAQGATDFSGIATLKAAGNTSVEKNYTYADRNLNDGNYQYRIKSVDLDGQSVYSSIRNVVLNCAQEELMYVFPNPAIGNASLVIRTVQDDNFNIRLTDMAGKLIYQRDEQLNNEAKTILLPTNDLPNGIYNLSVKNSYDTKFFKIHKLQ